MKNDATQGQRILSGALSVSVKNLCFSYENGTKVFDDFSCDFESGELTAVCGPTGKGKSTLAALILGVLKPNSGSIRIYLWVWIREVILCMFLREIPF